MNGAVSGREITRLTVHVWVSSVIFAIGLLKWEKHNSESSYNSRLDGSMMTHVEEIITRSVGLYCVLFAQNTNWMRCANLREGGKERGRENVVSSFLSTGQWFYFVYLENDRPLTYLTDLQSQVWWLIFRISKKRKFVKKDNENSVVQKWLPLFLYVVPLKKTRKAYFGHYIKFVSI